MSKQSLQGYVGSNADASRRQFLEKARESMFERSEQEKKRMSDETAAYRLQSTGDKFSSSTSTADSALAQATVGLVSKEEFARRRMALEAAESGADAPPEGVARPEGGAAGAKGKKGKKKRKEVGGLSFALDDGEEEGGGGGGGDCDESSLPPNKLKKKKKPASPTQGGETAEADAHALLKSSPRCRLSPTPRRRRISKRA